MDLWGIEPLPQPVHGQAGFRRHARNIANIDAQLDHALMQHAVVLEVVQQRSRDFVQPWCDEDRCPRDAKRAPVHLIEKVPDGYATVVGLLVQRARCARRSRRRLRRRRPRWKTIRPRRTSAHSPRRTARRSVGTRRTPAARPIISILNGPPGFGASRSDLEHFVRFGALRRSSEAKQRWNFQTERRVGQKSGSVEVIRPARFSFRTRI
jgi:hypothetical protein